MSDADVPNRGPAVFAVTTAMLTLATLFMVARLVSRVLIVRRTAWCDYTIALAWLINVFLCLSITIGARRGLGKYDRDIPPENRPALRMCEYVFSILYSPALMATKTSILIFYLRLSKHTQRMLRLASWVTLFVVLTMGTVITFLNIFQCEPTNAAWDITVQPIECIPLLTEFTCTAPVSVVTSLAILALPIPVLTGMRLPMRQKTILVATFALGIFVTIVDVVRIYYLEQALGLGATDATFGQVPDFAWNAAPAMMWSAVEVNVAIICACVPTLKPLVRRVLPCLLANRQRRASWQRGSGTRSGTGGKSANETSLSTPPPVGSFPDDAASRRPSSFSQTTSSSDDISLRHFLLASNPARAPAPTRPPALPPATYPKQTHFSPSGPSHRRHHHLPTFITSAASHDDNNNIHPTSHATNPHHHPHHHHHSHHHSHKHTSINRKNMLTLTPRQTLLACTPPTILFFLWGFSSGLLVSLNTAVGNPLVGMSQAQMLGLMGVFYGGGYLVGPLVGGWILQRADEGYVSVWRGWSWWWRRVRTKKGRGRGRRGNGWSWRWGVRRGVERGGDGGGVEDGEVDEEEGQGDFSGGRGQTKRRGLGCIGWEHRWGGIPGLRKLSSATTTTATTTTDHGGRRRSDEVYVAERRVGGFRATFIAGLLIYGAGSMTFWPGAVLEAYGGFMVSNFFVGAGLAVLETAANPFLVLCGPPRYADARLLLAQALEAVGGVLGVLLVDKVFSARVQGGAALLGVQWTYLAITLLSVLLALFFYYVPLPEASGAQLAEMASSRRRADARRRWCVDGVSLRTWAIGLAVLAQWCYISAQEIASLFFGSLVAVFNVQHPSGMGLSPANYMLVAHAAFALARFLAGALCCFSASFPTSPFLLRPRTLLAVSVASLAACMLTVVVLPASTDPGLAAIPVILFAFFMGPIWPLIFSLGLRGQGERTKRAAMWITMGGSGAGIWPFVSYGVLRAGGSMQVAMVVVVALLAVAGVYPLFLGRVKRARALVDVPRDGESGAESEIELRRGCDDKKGPSAMHLEGGLLGQQLSPGWPGTRGLKLLGSEFNWDPSSQDQGRQADQRAPWEDQALDTTMLQD